VAIPFERLGWLFAHWGRRAYPEWAKTELTEWIRRLPSGSHVLDLGGGTGVLTNWAAMLRDDLKYTIVDISPGMLAHADKAAEKLIANAEDLPFADSSIDAIMMGEALHHFKNSKQALREIARVLRFGGHFWIYDFDPARGMGRWIYWGEKFLGEPASFYRPGELEAHLQKLGLGAEYKCRKGIYVLKGSRLA